MPRNQKPDSATQPTLPSIPKELVDRFRRNRSAGAGVFPYAAANEEAFAKDKGGNF